MTMYCIIVALIHLALVHSVTSEDGSWCEHQHPQSTGCVCLLAQHHQHKSLETLARCLDIKLSSSLWGQEETSGFLADLADKFDNGVQKDNKCTEVSDILSELSSMSKWLAPDVIPTTSPAFIMHSITQSQLANNCSKLGSQNKANASAVKSLEGGYNDDKQIAHEENEIKIREEDGMMKADDKMLSPEDFVADVFAMEGAGDVMTVLQFSSIMERLGVGTELSNADVIPEHATNRARRHVDNKDMQQNNTLIHQCFSATSLFGIHNVSESIISHSDFSNLCPALVQQQLSGACSAKPHLVDPSSEDPESQLHKYGYSSLCVLIISACSLLGVIYLPCLSTRAQEYIMALCLALAVGALCGDSILHLFPSAFGLNVQTYSGNESLITMHPHLYKALAVLAAVYLFYLVETIITVVREGLCRNTSVNDETDSGSFTRHQLDLVSHSPRSLSSVQVDVHENPRENNNYADSADRIWYIEDNSSVRRSSRGFHTSFSQFRLDLSTPPPTIISETVIESAAFLVIICDLIHNIANGLVMGSSFNQSSSVGFSSSIAVLFHEIPHELVDFAILLQSGMSFKAALLCNLGSCLASFMGLYLGLSLSISSLLREWLFTLASGMYLYLALACLTPSLISMQRNTTSQKKMAAIVVLQNVGYIVGVASYLLLIMFEHNIGKLFQYL